VKELVISMGVGSNILMSLRMF